MPLVAGALFPGAGGLSTSGLLTFERKRERRRASAPLDGLDPIVFSEAARAVDLLVSVASFALDNAADHTSATAADAHRLRVEQDVREHRLYRLLDVPLGAMARQRRQVLSLVFAEQVEQGRLSIDERHVRASKTSRSSWRRCSLSSRTSAGYGTTNDHSSSLASLG
ncbi:hypothetical protein [Burkholderia ubonensis]